MKTETASNAPIGNPQNVLVAIQSGMNAPFIKFVEYLAIPTLINLYITAYLIKRIYRIGSPRLDLSAVPREEILSSRDAILSLIGLIADCSSRVACDQRCDGARGASTYK
jgi:Na+/H+ antiporter NhaD/arsenite permease-like protein